ncbi:hypothetical protein [Actinoplanes subglobosus]|uniref:Uncharacterized protein n=1 Tax=Actinoplanes subglobosus TaxID=1547892 RepID=A0ABV8IY88_9ACTN
MVRIVAAGVALLGALNILRLIVQTALTFSGDEWSTGSRTVFLVLNAIPFALSVFLLPLAFQLVRGRMWAWVTALVLVSLATLIGSFALLVSFSLDGFPFLGLAMFVLPLAVLLGLVVPREVRAYFTARPAPAAYSGYPAPGPWGPPHR